MTLSKSCRERLDWSGLAAGLASGGLLALAWRWPALAILAWVALVPWLRRLWGGRTGSWQHAWAVGAAAGTVYYGVILWPFTSIAWWGWATVKVAQLPSLLSGQQQFMTVAWLLASLWGGAWWGLWSVLVWRLRNRPPLVRLLVVPALWIVLLEGLGYRTVWQLTWGGLGYLLAEARVTRQLASLLGVAGLGWLIVWVNATLAIACEGLPRYWRAGRSFFRMPPAVRRAVIAGVGVLIGCQSYSLLQLAQPLTVRKDQVVRVALLQGASSPYVTRRDFLSDGLSKTYGPMVDEALARRAQLIVLPESVWLATLSLDGTRLTHPDPYLVDLDTMARSFADRLHGRDTVLAIGMDTVERGRRHNSVLYWSRDGLLGRYHKRALVPFAEYQPAWVGRFAPENQVRGAGFAYAPAAASRVVRAGPHGYGSLLCQEVLRPDLVRETVRDGATLLLVPGNEGVFASPAVPRVLLAAARLRAVEHRRWVLRAMKNGGASVIDAWGDVVQRAPAQRHAVVFGMAASTDVTAPYTSFGHGFAWGVGALAWLGLAVPVLGRTSRDIGAARTAVRTAATAAASISRAVIHHREA